MRGQFWTARASCVNCQYVELTPPHHHQLDHFILIYGILLVIHFLAKAANSPGGCLAVRPSR